MAWFMTFFFTRRKPEVRQKAVRFIGIWVLGWAPLVILSGLWYWNVVPSVMRANGNVALLTQKFMNWQDTIALIKKVGGNLVRRVKVFDLYSGEQIPEGFVGLSLSVEFQARDRTLTAEEVDALFGDLKDALGKELGAQIR